MSASIEFYKGNGGMFVEPDAAEYRAGKRVVDVAVTELRKLGARPDGDSGETYYHPKKDVLYKLVGLSDREMREVAKRLR